MWMALLMCKHQHLFRRSGYGMEWNGNDTISHLRRRTAPIFIMHRCFSSFFFAVVQNLANSMEISIEVGEFCSNFQHVWNRTHTNTYDVRIEYEDDDDCYANVIGRWKIYRYTHQMKWLVWPMPRPKFIQFQEKSINTTDTNANKINFVWLFFANNQRNEFFFYVHDIIFY